jgi:hypothetical protein
MNLISLLHIYAVVITLKNGLFSGLRIRGLEPRLGMESFSPRAKTEVRTMWGGLYLGMGIAGLVFSAPEVYKMIGIAYMVSNVIRGISMIVGKSADRAGLQRMSYEIILAVFLFL